MGRSVKSAAELYSAKWTFPLPDRTSVTRTVKLASAGGAADSGRDGAGEASKLPTMVPMIALTTVCVLDISIFPGRGKARPDNGSPRPSRQGSAGPGFTRHVGNSTPSSESRNLKGKRGPPEQLLYTV